MVCSSPRASIGLSMLGGVDSILGGARADHSVELVDERSTT